MLRRLYSLFFLSALVLPGCDSDPASAPPPPDGETADPLVWMDAPATGAIGRSVLITDPFADGAVWAVTYTQSVYYLAGPTSEWERRGTLGSAPIEDELGASARGFASALEPGVLYANGVEGGERSLDAGDSWERCANDYQVLAVHPTRPGGVVGRRLFDVYDQPGDLFFSEDHCRSWAPLGTVIDADVTINAVAYHPTDPDRLLAAVAENGHTDEGIFQSADGGATWAEVGAQGAAYALATSPAAPDRAYHTSAFTSQRFYRSEDFGASWGEIAVEAGYNNLLLADPTDADRLYIGGYVLLTSNSGGETWSFPALSRIEHMALSPSGDHLYLAQQAGVVYWATRGPKTFRALSAGLDPETDWLVRPADTDGSQFTGPADALHVLGYAVIYRHEPSAGRWTRLPVPLFESRLLAVSSSNPDRLYVYGQAGTYSPSPQHLATSTNGGRTWSVREAPEGLVRLAVAPWDPNALVALGPFVGSSAGREVWASEDAGASWQHIETAPLGEAVGLLTVPATSDLLLHGHTDVSVAEGSVHDWRTLSSDTLTIEAVAVRTAPTEDVLIHAGDGLYRLTPGGAPTRLADLPTIDAVTSFALLPDPLDGLLLAGRFGGVPGVLRLDPDGYRQFRAQGGAVDLAVGGGLVHARLPTTTPHSDITSVVNAPLSFLTE